MVIRELKDGSSWVSTQEDHAELSAQFAAHWGNERFAKLRPYNSMVFATTYHDSGYREWEGSPPVNPAKGRPYAHREEIPSFEAVELRAYAKNVDWLRAQDRYAALLVSMHRTGLWQNRYQVFTSPKGRLRERSAEIKAAMKEMEARQQEDKAALGAGKPNFENDLWVNYRALQIYDLLSLYFCCDGYDADDRFKADVLAPIRLGYDSPAEVELRIVPTGEASVKMEPYPFDISPLKIAVRARRVPRGQYATEETCLEAYHKAPRQMLTFEITN
jgi:hypothetical protein